MSVRSVTKIILYIMQVISYKKQKHKNIFTIRWFSVFIFFSFLPSLTIPTVIKILIYFFVALYVHKYIFSVFGRQYVFCIYIKHVSEYEHDAYTTVYVIIMSYILNFFYLTYIF